MTCSKYALNRYRAVSIKLATTVKATAFPSPISRNYSLSSSGIFYIMSNSGIFLIMMKFASTAIVKRAKADVISLDFFGFSASQDAIYFIVGKYSS